MSEDELSNLIDVPVEEVRKPIKFLKLWSQLLSLRLQSRMFEQFMMLNETVFAEGHYEVSYHLLKAALHYAQNNDDAPALTKVAEKAIEQGDWFEFQLPEHKFSSPLQERGNSSMFRLLAQQAYIAVEIVSRKT